MSGAFNIGGLATGLDTNAIVDKLIQLDGRPKSKLQWRQQLEQNRQNIWNDLNSKLGSFNTNLTKLLGPSAWTSFSGVNSSDASKVSAAAIGAKPASGNHTVAVSQLATREVWSSSISLPVASSGVRTSGAWYAPGPAVADGSTLLTDLVDQSGSSAGLDAGSSITLDFRQGVRSFSATYSVGAGATLGDLASWVQSQVPGATVEVSAGGELVVTGEAGTSREVTALSFSATDSSGASLARFNGSSGARSSMTAAASDGGVAAGDTLQVTQGASSWYVNIAAGDNLAAIAAKINATSGIGVTATVSGGSLQLASTSSGATGGFSVSSSGSLVADIGLAESTAGQDATFTVDGAAYTRSRNTGITDVLADVQLDLVAITASPVTVSVGDAAVPTETIVSQVKALADQYNSVLDFISGVASQKKVANPKTLQEYLSGPLARNYDIQNVATQLRSQIGNLVAAAPSGYQLASQVGITTDKAGRITVDEAKLTAAINTDRSGVKTLLTNAGSGSDVGLLRRMSTLVGNLRIGGTIDSNIKGISTQLTTLQDSIDRWTDRLDRRKSHYQRMYNNMESLVGKMQSQSSSLMNQLAGMQ